MIDFSVFKNIDFTNRDTLIFLSVVFVLAIVIFSVFLFIASKIINGIKRLLSSTFNVDVKRPKFDQIGQKENKEDVSWLKKPKGNEEIDNIPKAKIAVINPERIFDVGEKQFKEVNKDIVKLQREKTEKNIAEGLSRLESNNSAGDNHNFEMPVPAREKTEKNIAEGLSRLESNNSAGGAGFMAGQNAGNSVGDNYNFEMPAPVIGKNDDPSIFGGKAEVSRSELRQKLKGTKAYKAGRQVGLNLSLAERAKLEKEVFSQGYGRNISKKDLKLGVRKLNQKMLNAKDSVEHAKLRKEIKFFKKIGGIK